MRLCNVICFVFMVAACCMGAEPANIVPDGNMEASEKQLRQQFLQKAGRLTFVKEEIGDNHCAKMEMTNIVKNPITGIETANANMHVLLPGLKAGKTYGISFDLTGSALRFMLHILRKGGGKFQPKMLPPEKSNAVYLEVTADWKEYACTFKVPEEGEYMLNFSLWHSTRYGKMFYSIGDFLLIDNIVVREISK